MVSTMLLCENINTAIGSIIINTTEAAPAPAREIPAEIICDIHS